MVWISVLGALVLGAGVGVLLGRRVAPGGDAEREVRRLRLDLEESTGRADDMAAAAERSRAETRVARDDAAREASELLAQRVAEPLAFLAVQIHHVDSGSAGGLTLTDLSATATNLVAALGESGVSCAGVPGEQTTFDPDLHNAVIGSIDPGRTVRILVPGVTSISGTTARRAVVEEE